MPEQIVLSFESRGTVEADLTLRARIADVIEGGLFDGVPIERGVEDTSIDNVPIDGGMGNAHVGIVADDRVMESGVVCYIAINSALQGSLANGVIG